MEKQREMSTNGHLSRTSDSFSTPPLKSAKLRPPLSTLIPSSARGSIKLNHVDHVLVGERNCSPGPTIRSTIAIPPFLPSFPPSGPNIYYFVFTAETKRSRDVNDRTVRSTSLQPSANFSPRLPEGWLA